MDHAKRLLALALIAALPCSASAEGELDTSYGGGDGKARVSFDQASTPDGKADHLLDVVAAARRQAAPVRQLGERHVHRHSASRDSP